MTLHEIFTKKELEDISFLEKLSDEEQNQLANLIEKKLDAEGGPMLSAMAMVANVLPSFLKVKISQDVLGPKMVAKMTSYVPTKQAISMASSMKIDFLADVAIHQKPEQVVEVIEASPDRMLLEISKILLQRGQFEILSRFADHLSSDKLRLLAERLDDIDGLVQIAHFMQNKQRVIDTALHFSDSYLIKLMQGVAKFEYYEMAAMVGQSIEVDRQLTMLKDLELAMAARLAAHYHPETIAKMIDRIDDETIVDIALQLDATTLGNLYNYLPSEQVNRLIPFLSLSKLADALPEINLKKIEKEWNTLSESVVGVINKLAKDYDPLASLIKNLRE